MRRRTTRVVGDVRYSLSGSTRFTTRLEPWALVTSAVNDWAFNSGTLVERFRTKRDALDTLDQL